MSEWGCGTEAELQTLGRLLMGAPPGPDLDWDALVDLAQRHEVVPLLLWKLARERPPGRIPVAILETLQSYFYTAAVRAMVVEQELAQVLEALAAAAVPALVVKGAAAALFYADPALRTYADLDILVPQALLDKAEHALNGLGYGSTRPKGWRMKHHRHLPPLVKEDNLVGVEIHWRLDNPGQMGCLPPEELWARAVPWSVEGQPALRLEPVDAVLYLCTHAVVQNLGRLGLRPVCDLAQVVDGWTRAEWDTLVQRAVDYGQERIVFFQLLLADQLGLDVPQMVLEGLRPSGGEPLPGDLAERFLAAEPRAAAPMPGTAVRAWAEGSLSTRLQYFVRRLFPSRDGMAELYNVPADSPRIWLTYLRRPVDLLRRHGRGTWKALRGDPAARAAWDREVWLERWLRG